MTPTSDSNLILAAAQGDAEALSQLLRQHGPLVLRRLRIDALWQSSIDADDIMQVSYLEAFLQFDRFDTSRPDSFEGWLMRIAQNNLRDAIRGLSRAKDPQPANRVHATGRNGGDSFVGLLETLGAISATPSRAAARDETQNLIESALTQLPADYATVVRLYDLEGNAIGDVAKTMGRSSGAIHMLRARAHDALRRVLGRESMFFSHTA